MQTDVRTALAGQVAHESKFQWLTRVGFAARGILYVLIGLLVFRTGQTEDLTGALEYVGRGGGTLLLAAIAAGLAAYGLWRLSDAALGTEHPGTDRKVLGKRAAAGFIGGIYLYLAYKTVLIIVAGRAGTADTRSQADTVLDLPGGEIVLMAAALVLAIAGANQLWKAGKCDFMHRLREGAGQQKWIKWMGRAGYAARGVIFFVVSWLIFQASVEHSASEAGSLEQALDVLRGPFQLPIAAGLMLFGLFSLVEARFRTIHKPPTDGLGREVKERLGG
ncbi:MAG TPA: DUF1206 domain-containing protein [Sphingomicrobium sp.]|nr:DUF1206 domain-containing protein [Sphingomicrobium sp.]